MKLNDCLDFISYGFTNPMSDSDDGPWKLTAKDIIDGKINYNTARHTTTEEYLKLTNKSRPKIGDILLTKDGTLGRVAVVDRDNVCINQSVAVLRPNNLVVSEYLKYLLMTDYYQELMLGDANGSTIKHLYITKVAEMDISLPDKETQKEIVNVLGDIDGQIERNNAVVQKLPTFRTTTYCISHKKGEVRYVA